MRQTILTFLIAILIASTACINKKKSTKIIVENGGKKPVLIANLFPEAGLTDPHTIQANGRLYIFCGHDKSWDTEDTWKMDRWEIHSTDDLVNWKKESEILPTDTYIGDKPNCWAGDITERNGKYYWYFSNRNHNTGVMVADTPTGPFKDALDKPLLPNGIIGKGHPYDPEIFVEDGIYTMFFGSGHYYAVTLAEDMISLADKPRPIKVQTKDGKDKWTADKSTLFKRGNIYYLLWGPNYAMSNNLYGPYTYEGRFLAGGHNNVFQWKGQWYAVMENKDISLFYRGVSLKPIFFKKDGTINVPKDDQGYPANGRSYSFNHSTMGWQAVTGTTLEWDKKGFIKGTINGKAVIQNSVWAGPKIEDSNQLRLSIRNKSTASKAIIRIATYNPKNAFWKYPGIDWSKEFEIELDIAPNSSEFKDYYVDLSQYPKLKKWSKRIRIEPAFGVDEGSWEINYFGITK